MMIAAVTVSLAHYSGMSAADSALLLQVVTLRSMVLWRFSLKSTEPHLLMGFTRLT